MHTRERGVTLLVTMLMLIGVLLLGASASDMVLLGEKAARAERNRQLAFQSAEDAIMDAESDIKGTHTSPERRARFAAPDLPPCTASAAGMGGLCASAAGEAGWEAVDLSGAATATFGEFTGAEMETGSGFLPFRRPRYLIERLPAAPAPGAAAGEGPSYRYRVTAIGFASRPGQQVVLQAMYRSGTGREGWRELPSDD